MRRTAILVAALLALPAVSAQTDPDVVTSLRSWDGTLRVGQVHDTTLIVEYNCAKADQVQGTPIDINVTHPIWANVTGPREITVQPDPADCLGNQTRLSQSIAYQVEVTRTAPALVEEPVTFNATAQFPDGDASDESQETLAAHFLADVAVAVDPAGTEIFAGRTAEHNLTLTNRGNGPMTVTVTVASADDGLAVGAPSGGQAPSPLGDEEPVWRGQVSVRGSLPEGVDEETYGATLQLRAAYADDPSESSTERTINLTATVRRHPSEIEDDGAVPGFEVVGVVAAAAVVALWKRR